MALHSLVADPIALGVPVLGTPIITQHHNLVADPVAIGAPVLGEPTATLDQMDRWPFKVNWRSPWEQTFEYKTDILTGRDGTETQRRALRTEPRRTMAYDAMVYRDAMREAMRFATGRFDEILYVSNPTLSTRLASPLTATTGTFTVDAVPAWLQVGTAGIISYDGAYELVQVFDITGTTITIRGVAFSTWPAGAKFSLAEPSRIAGPLRLKAETRGVVTAKIILNIEPEAVALAPVSAAGATFDGRELFLKSPNWREGLDIDISSLREIVDYGVGRIAGFSPVAYTARDYRATYLGRSVEETWETIDFFRRMRGRQGEFFCPSGTADLKPIETLASGTAILKTSGKQDYIAFNNDGITSGVPVNKALIVVLNDGSYVCKKINSVALSGGDSAFTVDSNWSSSIAIADISYVSFLPLCRFGSDTLSVSWLTSGVAQFNLPIHTLAYLPAE